ncbi:unnamed protein product [Closterium sp. NIES-54]
MIEGLVETYPNLQYLDGFPDVKVVLRADVSRGTYGKVAIISGGGSGHEPAHAGFVGKGMLSAAVCGDVFASPSVNAVLMSYTGDRLNFGLAAEQAKEEGFKVDMVVVGDDCALPPPRGIAGRRGLAGTVFVHKVAGAAAEEGKSLADVAAEARQVAGLVGTMGVGLSVCTVPGGFPSDRLPATKMELGLGIHGEPGAAVVDMQPVDVVVSHMLKTINNPDTGYMPLKLGSRVALMVNRYGEQPSVLSLVFPFPPLPFSPPPPSSPPPSPPPFPQPGRNTSYCSRQGCATGFPPPPPLPIPLHPLPPHHHSPSLGATPAMEVMIAAGKAVAQLQHASAPIYTANHAHVHLFTALYPSAPLCIPLHTLCAPWQVEHGLAVERVYAGHFMTSLDMSGLSLSVLKVDDQVLQRLDAPTLAPAWPNACQGARPATKVPVPLPPAPPGSQPATACECPEELTEEGRCMERCIRGGAQAVLAVAADLNAWDAKIGDGDCGSTMSRGAKAVLEALASRSVLLSHPRLSHSRRLRFKLSPPFSVCLHPSVFCLLAPTHPLCNPDSLSSFVLLIFSLPLPLRPRYPLNDAPATIREMGASVRCSMGGTSGVIYDIFCRSAYVKLRELAGPAAQPTPAHWAAAFEAAVAAVSLYGGAQAGYRTMLDALLPAAATLSHSITAGEPAAAALAAAAQAAAAGAESTKSMPALSMVALAGRSSYVPAEVLASVPDPGAMAVVAWLQGVATAMQPPSQPVFDPVAEPSAATAAAAPQSAPQQ